MKKIVLTTFYFALAAIFLPVNTFAASVAPTTTIQTQCLFGDAPAGVIFLDPDSKTVMVDLKQLEGAASEIRVTDTDGKVVITKDISKMHTDDMVELDVSKLEAGNYTVEVSTYSQTLKQAISL